MTQGEATGIDRTSSLAGEPPTDLRWRVIRPTSGWRAKIDLRELWAQRELALILAFRDLKLRYRQTLFGVAWAVLQPLIGMGLFSVIFGSLADVPSDGLPYPLFVLTGLAVWFFVSTSVSTAAESFVQQPDLVTKVWFPRMLAPIAAVLAAGLDLGISLLLVAVAMVGYAVAPGIQVLTLPLWIAAAMLVAVGAGLWLSAANALYRDVRYALAFLLQVWFFASPVVFPSSLIDGAGRYVFALNPMAGVIDGFRWALLDGPVPGPWLGVSAASLVALLLSGALYFSATERRFADKI
jgi:lipopolysaccharide transport system permease protein